jgi:hypothetical protein
VCGKISDLRARLVTQTRVILKASRITKFDFPFTQMSWTFCRKKEIVGNQPLAEHFRPIDRLRAASSFRHNKLAMRQTRAARSSWTIFYSFE